MPESGAAADRTAFSEGAGAGPASAHCVSALLHQFAESLGNAIDAKDPHTSRHSDEVAEISRVLALALGLGRSRADAVHVAGHLHDIGKIGVPDAVLGKQGPLTTAEWAAMRKHSEAGAAILEPVSGLRALGIVDMVLHHHERYDGRGYPHGLAGPAIPPGARIIALADTLSAMLQNRPYRCARTFAAARDEILRCSGTQFDPAVVRAFAWSEAEIRTLITRPPPRTRPCSGPPRRAYNFFAPIPRSRPGVQFFVPPAVQRRAPRRANEMRNMCKYNNKKIYRRINNHLARRMQ